MKKLLAGGALALALVLAAGSVFGQQVWKWSTTSGTNATADPAINWAEGMSPSSVNDSARAMMAAIARARLDTSGSISSTGTSTAYVLTTNSSYTPAVGTVVAFFAHATNGASPTLNVDGSGAKPIQVRLNEAVAEGTIVALSPYSVLYCASCNGGSGSWILQSVYGAPTTIPIGGVIDYLGTSAPNSNFALAAGQAISRTTYATLFALVGTTFGAGDGSTTFNLPDLRGRVVAGLDNLGGSAAGRITAAGGNFDGTVLGGAGGAQNHTLTTAQIASHTHAGTTDATGDHTHTGTTDAGGTHSHTVNINDSGHSHVQNHTLVAFGAGGGSIMSVSTPGGNSWSTGSATTGITASTVDAGSHTHTFTTAGAGAHSHTFTSGATGGGASHPIVQPTMTLGKIIRIF